MRKSPFLIYRNSIALSIAIHLFCVTTAEAAMFWGKAFVPHFDEPILTIKAVHRERISQPGQGILVPKIKKPSQNEPIKKPAIQQTLDAAQQKSETTAQPQPIPRPPSFQGFQHFQTGMDQRIQKVKDHLMDLAGQRLRSESNELLVSQISDLDKVPVKVRTSTLPEYLKQMRFRIAKDWLQEIESHDFRSETAKVRYRIAPDGAITELELQSGEGNESFLKVCLSAVSKASPFAPLPFQFEKSEKERYLTVVLTFHLRK